MKGRRVGDGAFSVELRIESAEEEGRVRDATLSSASLSSDDAPLEFRFTPLAVAAGSRYTLTLHAGDATPIGRAAFTYTRTASRGPLRFNGKPLYGSLDLQEIFDGGDQ